MSENWQGLLAELYTDADLMASFRADPVLVLKEKGFTPPEGVQFKVMEDTAALRHLVIPYLDPEGEANLEQVETRLNKCIVL